MVDKGLIFITKNDKYAIIKNDFNNRPNTIGKIIYSNGESLNYGDAAEIFGVLNLEEEFTPFLELALSEMHFSREHYGFIFGYQPADYENEEIKVGEVRIHYSGVDNTITKKEFYELCLLMCNAKLKTISSDSDITEQELFSIKSQLEEKIKAF